VIGRRFIGVGIAGYNPAMEKGYSWQLARRLDDLSGNVEILRRDARTIEYGNLSGSPTPICHA
jgi:hypothetical protein